MMEYLGFMKTFYNNIKASIKAPIKLLLAKIGRQLNSEIKHKSLFDELKIVRDLIQQKSIMLDQINQQIGNSSQVYSCSSGKFPSLACQDASELFTVFAEINSNVKLWSECDILFSCPIMHSGALCIFSDKNIVKVNQPSDIYNAINGRKFTSLGIISPWLPFTFEEHPEILVALVQGCRDRLLMLNGDKGVDHVRLRKVVHRSGFYEIAIPAKNNTFDFSTVGCLPDGRFDFFGSEPGFLSPDCWVTLVASRLPICDVSQLAWKNIFSGNHFVAIDGLFGTDPGGFALAVTHCSSQSKEVSGMEIRGTINWVGQAIGNASLVACYSGPGNTNMYIAMLEVIDDCNFQVSLLINNGGCLRLDSTPVNPNMILLEGSSCNLPIWLRVDADAVSLGSANTQLLHIKNNQLSRIPSVGIMVSENYFSFSNISYIFSDIKA